MSGFGEWGLFLDPKLKISPYKRVIGEDMLTMQCDGKDCKAVIKTDKDSLVDDGMPEGWAVVILAFTHMRPSTNIRSRFKYREEVAQKYHVCTDCAGEVAKVLATVLEVEKT